MQETEDETKQKQNYLRTEILEKGYDTSKFVVYLSSQKVNGQDIDNWTFHDLKNAVTSYLVLNPKPDKEQPYTVVQDQDDSGDESPTKASKGVEFDGHMQAEHEAQKIIMIDDKIMGTDNQVSIKKDQPTKLTNESDIPDFNSSSMNDQRQQITKMIINQSDEERTAMNDFALSVVPLKQPKLNELNGERRLKIKISE